RDSSMRKRGSLVGAPTDESSEEFGASTPHCRIQLHFRECFLADCDLKVANASASRTFPWTKESSDKAEHSKAARRHRKNVKSLA
ncbi:MAG: hypothetical protein KDA47_01530, partial [Planctomycetales bacterium]|nr:hypothetical protein [Planctomycetales bacterium]